MPPTLPTPSLPSLPEQAAVLRQAQDEGDLDGPLFAAADRVLRSWAQLPPRRLLYDPAAPVSGLHCAAELIGAQAGSLVLSGSERLGTMLAFASQTEARASGVMPEALLRLAALIRSELLRGKNGGHLPPPPRWATREALPKQRPSAAIQLNVNGYPLLCRLWLEHA